LSAAEDEAEARRRAIELLEANHAFPCQFSFSVIATGDEATTAAILRELARDGDAPLAPEAHQKVSSSGGKYVSHRLNLPCHSADHVLDLFARLRAVSGVVTVL
jgi:putative lipoic acid-binding regulatory protein